MVQFNEDFPSSGHARPVLDFADDPRMTARAYQLNAVIVLGVALNHRGSSAVIVAVVKDHPLPIPIGLSRDGIVCADESAASAVCGRENRNQRLFFAPVKTHGYVTME